MKRNRRLKKIESDEKINFTVSLGIETSTPDDNTIDELFKRADMKLYGAKGKGRDRIEY